jgi:hypothetical protein
MPILLKHQPWTNDPSRPERDTEIEGNMWRSRQPPYHDLDVGSLVILVSGGGPTAGMLTWEVDVTAVAKGQYASHDEAFRLLRAGVGRERLKEAGAARPDLPDAGLHVKRGGHRLAAGMVLPANTTHHAPPAP